MWRDRDDLLLIIILSLGVQKIIFLGRLNRCINMFLKQHLIIGKIVDIFLTHKMCTHPETDIKIYKRQGAICVTN